MATRGRHRVTKAGDEALAGTFSSPACYLHEFEVAGSDKTQRPRGRGVAIKRIYDAPESADGYRVLIDRLWPRGMSKRRACLDAWLIELAPSTALRTWFHRDLKRWPEFARRYRAELREQKTLLQSLRQRARRQRVTLLYAARDVRVNHAIVLGEVLRRSTRAASTAAVRVARSASRRGTPVGSGARGRT